MMIRPNVNMMEALRLTRQGRLEEAMAVLRGALPESEASVKREAGEGTAPVLDMVPPSMATGSAWTAPPTGAASDAPQRGNIRDRIRGIPTVVEVPSWCSEKGHGLPCVVPRD